MIKLAIINIVAILVFSTPQWDLIKDKDGIKIYTRTIDGSDFKEYKAEMVIKNSSVNDILNIIFEISEEISDLENHLKQISVYFERQSDGSLHTFLNNKDVETEIRTMEVSNNVSEVSQYAKVREKMVALQRDMGNKKAIILDGRDIGTVVFPNAEVKIFLTAKAEVRAKRRFDEMKEKGEDVKYEAVLKNITERDFKDENRKESPLRKAADAVVLDNSDYSREMQLQKALEIIDLKL